MSTGRLVPDSLACEIVAQRLAEDDCNDGYILDGFPRSVPQAEELERVLADRNELLDVALVLEVGDEELVERLSSRRTCPVCGTIYNLKFQPPKHDEQCDDPKCDGAKLVQRDDDQEATIRKRLNIYHETTEPLIDFYTRKGLRKSVGGDNMTPDEIATKIEDILMDEKGIVTP
jgi:adenylate kinase